MEVIHIHEEHALIQLSSVEVRALANAWRRVLAELDKDSLGWKFDMTQRGAWDLAYKLNEALVDCEQ